MLTAPPPSAATMLCLTSSPAPLLRRSPADRPGPGTAGGAGGNVRLSVSSSVPSSLRWSRPGKVKSKFSVPVTPQGNKTMTTADEDFNHLPIYELDLKLAEFKDHFNYRMKRYLDQKRLIEKNEGSLEEFSKGYLKFGINTDSDASVYREWAPAAKEAQLVGDFNNWNGAKHKMEEDKFGVWSIKISHVNGKPAIPHNSKVKFRFRHGDGVWVDRIPAWIRYATFDASKFGAPYDSVHWIHQLVKGMCLNILGLQSLMLHVSMRLMWG